MSNRDSSSAKDGRRTYRAVGFVGTIIAWIVGATLILMATMSTAAGYPQDSFFIVGGVIVAIAAIATVFARSWFDDLIEATIP